MRQVPMFDPSSSRPTTFLTYETPDLGQSTRAKSYYADRRSGRRS